MASYSEDLVKVIGEQVFTDQDRFTASVDRSIESVEKLVELYKGLGGGSGLGSAVNAQGQLVQLQKEATKATEDAKRAKAEERELNRLIAEEEKARKKQAASDERELTRLIKIETGERAKAMRDSVRQANKEKADSDKAYIQQYKKLLEEKEKADKDANKRMTEEAKKAAKAAADAVDPSSLKAMSARLEGLRQGYARLTQAERENAEIGGVVLARIKELDAALKKSDADQGKFTRNVGNYASAYNGLGFAIKNIAGELPNFGISIRTGFQAISNNIQGVIDGLNQIRAQNAALAAEGKPTVSTLKSISGALFNWNTAILLAVAGITYLVTNMKTSTSAFDMAEKATKKYEETLKSVAESERSSANEEIAHLNVLVAIATNRATSDKNRKRALEELQKTYPDYFKNLDLETIKQANLTSVINDATEALLARAAAQAAEKRFAAASENVYDLRNSLKEIDASIEGAKSSVERNKNNPIGFTRFEMERRLNNLYEERRVITEGLNKALSDQATYLEDARNSAQAAGQAIFGTDPKEKKDRVKRPVDMTAAELSAQGNEIEQFYRSAALAAQIDAETQKQIADDDTNTLEVRKEAYKKYIDYRLQVAGYGYSAEYDVIENQLQEITKIEGIEESKRTAAQKKLLLTREGLVLQQSNLLKQYELDNNKLIGNIAEFNADATDAATKRIKANLDSVGEFFKGTPGQSSNGAAELKKQQSARSAREQLAQQTIRVEQELMGIVADANRAKVDAIDVEIKKLKEQGEIQRAEIKLSGKTETEQKEALAALDAKLANDEFQLNEKKRQQQTRNARFEKAANISLLIQETALAVIRALSDKDTPAPLRFALAAGVGVLGAAQIARAAAAPLPAYKEGTPIGGHRKDGFAIVGDGGRREVMETKDGVFLTPSVPTAVYMRKGEVVHKSVEDYISKAQNMSLNSIPMLKPYNERVSMKKSENLLMGIRNELRSLNQKDPINLNLVGRGWNDYISDIYH